MSAPTEIVTQAQAVLAYLQSAPIEPPASAIPRPGHSVTEDPPLSVSCFATMFGLDWSGTIDSSDNGEGFFFEGSLPYDTRNPKLIGCSLPREVMLSTFQISDDWRAKGIKEDWEVHFAAVRGFVADHKPLLTIDSRGHTLSGVPLVDAGPAAGTNNGLDLTFAAAHLLDTQGKALVTYKIIVTGKVIPIKGWLWDKRKVG